MTQKLTDLWEEYEPCAFEPPLASSLLVDYIRSEQKALGCAQGLILLEEVGGREAYRRHLTHLLRMSAVASRDRPVVQVFTYVIHYLYASKIRQIFDACEQAMTTLQKQVAYACREDPREPESEHGWADLFSALHK